MTIFKKLTALCLAALLLLPGVPNVRADDSSAQLRTLVNYFHYYQEDAALDYELILEQIRAQDPGLANTWANILTFWSGINSGTIYSNVLPDGLPEDDSLCIVVMGYQLYSDGTMRPELESRMETALASARKYPNAYILCTGGGTASKNRNATEAGQMAAWLRRNGIDSSRIIVEGDAMSTIQNAIYGCALLYRNYPQVRSLAVITSDYHIFNSCLYFHTQAALDAYEAGIPPMRVVSNATCPVNPESRPDVSVQTEGIGILTGMEDVERMNQPWLTHLDHIRISGATEYVLGDELNLQITAVYSNGYTRDVTEKAHYTGFDFGKNGLQTVTVSYTEGLAEAVSSFEVYVIPDGGEPLPEEEKPTLPPEATLQEAPQKTTTGLVPGLVICGICIVLLILLVRGKKRKGSAQSKPPIHLS